MEASAISILAAEVFRPRSMERLPRPELGRTLKELFVGEPRALAGYEARGFLPPAGNGGLCPLRHLVEQGVECVGHPSSRLRSQLATARDSFLPVTTGT